MTDAAATAEPEKSLGGVTDPAVGQTPGRPAPEEHDLATVRPRSDGGDRWLPGPSELPPVGVSGGGTEAESVSAGSLARQLKPPSMATDGSGAINGQGMDGTGREGGPAGASVGTPGSLRRAPNRLQIAQQRGANPETERAVAAALQWIADNQEADGRWSAKRHEGGREIVEAGRDRNAAGSHADTGITGLALLALAASGNTHLEGNHREAVQKGLSFLLASQGSGGSLAGEGETYEAMYCHGMAALALSDLLATTDDPKLREPVRRAVRYTLSCQDPSGGGWRYRRQEPGDTSQLGWQLMALKTAEVARIGIPEETWYGARRFLDSVSSGNHHGLASYRPGESPSRSMTAEALACRQFLGISVSSPTAREGGDSLLGELPGGGDGVPNLYYWYYGTMAMYHLQGEHWRLWNEALQKSLLPRQRKSGALAGSWDPNGRWDGYGGRVYSTALATLCLEAFYRFFPLTGAEAASGGRRRIPGAS